MKTEKRQCKECPISTRLKLIRFGTLGGRDFQVDQGVDRRLEGVPKRVDYWVLVWN